MPAGNSNEVVNTDEVSEILVEVREVLNKDLAQIKVMLGHIARGLDEER